MDPIGVWFTQGYSNLYQALSDIRRADVEGAYRLVCSHPHQEFVGLQAADVQVVEPAGLNDAAHLEFVLGVVAKHNIKVIFPSRKQAWMNRHANVLAEHGVAVATAAPTRMLGRIDNKGRLYRYLADKGLVRLPDFECVQGINEFNKAYRRLSKLHATVCIKPTVGVYGSGFRVLKKQPNSLADLLSESLHLSVSDLRARLRVGPQAELMVMQYLEGDERSVDCVAFQGQLVGGVVRRKSGSAVAAQIVEDRPDLIAQVEGLVKALKLNGLFNVQFKDSGGEAFLLEINPRLSGRSYYATLAGLNLPYMAAELFSGRRSLEQATWTLKPGLLIGNVNAPVVLEGVERRERRASTATGAPESR